MGMEIKNVNNVEDGYSVVTTGAVFQIQKNRVQIFQRIAKSRKLALLQWSKSTNFKIIDRCSDHVVVQGDGLMVTIYGDSTCILHTASADTLRIQGEFLPEYIGRFGGELLLIDHYGGVQICSDRNRNNYPINAQCQANMPWQASYHLEKSERLMVAAFPERSFDWEKSFASNIIFTQAAQGRSYGKMPPKRLMRRWAENFQIMVIWHNGLYIPSNSGVTYAGPYDIADPIAFKEGIETAHCMGLKMIVYTSFYYFDEKHGNIDTYIEQIQKLKDNYGIDGVYIDGLLTEIDGHVHDQVFINWEIVRRLRKIFGQDGVIVYHGTAFGHAVATMPPSRHLLRCHLERRKHPIQILYRSLYSLSSKKIRNLKHCGAMETGARTVSRRRSDDRRCCIEYEWPNSVLVWSGWQPNHRKTGANMDR